jgi:hypothetical protein
MTRRLNSRRIRELDPRLAWLLMMLYPRAWRDRYGAEVLRLTRELIAAGETTPARAAANLACAAVAERCRALGHSWRPALAMAAAVLVFMAGGLYATGYAHRVTPASAIPVSAIPAGARPAAAVPASATLVRLLCSVPRPAPGGVPAGRVKAQPSQGAGRVCFELIARCQARKGHIAGKGFIIKLTPSHPVVRVTIRPAYCIAAVPGKAGTSGP